MEQLELVRNLELFRTLAPEDLEGLIEVGEVRPVPKGMVLMNEGDAADALAVVLAGTFSIEVTIEQGRQAIAEVGPGEILGETALFRTRARRSAQVAANQDSQVLVLTSDQLSGLAQQGSGAPRVLEQAVLSALIDRVVRCSTLIDKVVMDEGAEESGPPDGFFHKLRNMLGWS